MLLINVVPYSPEWPRQFEKIAESLRHALSDFLPEFAYRVEHVGSTSVSGLAAKPILDIDVIVPAWAVMEATMALTSHGYTYAYEANGIDRMVFRWNKHQLDSGASKPTEDGEPRRAVYLNKEGGAALANHMAVRETLRRDPELRDRYGKVKLELSGKEYESIGHYGGQKNHMLREILEKSGIGEDEILRIRKRPQRRIDAEIRQRKEEEEANAAKTA